MQASWHQLTVTFNSNALFSHAQFFEKAMNSGAVGQLACLAIDLNIHIAIVPRRPGSDGAKAVSS